MTDPAQQDVNGTNGLICAFDLDGAGGGRPLGWENLDGPPRQDGPQAFRWVHLNRKAAGAQAWLKERSGLDTTAVNALLAEDTRPRFTVYDDGVLINLRGVNLNPGAEPENMVAIRLWATPGRIVSARLFPIMAIRDIREAIAAGEGPRGIGAFVARLAARLTDRMEPTLDGLDERLGELEEAMVANPKSALRRDLGEVRREAIMLRRYIASQREALTGLVQAKLEWLDDDDREALAEQQDRVTRFVEDLDALRERAFVLQDELYSQLSDRMNRIVYILTVITGVFLPISFLTGLLGINVGGMPGTDSGAAFWIVCGLIAALVGVELAIFRFLKWI